MSEAAIVEYRTKMGMGPAKNTKIVPGGCPACGHATWEIGRGTEFCPCEDCHTGGHVIRTVLTSRTA